MRIDKERLDKLAWVDRVMTHPDWPKLRDHLLLSAELMREESFSITESPTPPQEQMLKACGLNAPKNPTEQMQVFFALRAVVSYMTTTMKHLDKNRQVYLDGIAELRRQGDLPEANPQETLKSA